VTTRICVSLCPKTIPEALRLIEESEDAQADLIEVRLDCLKSHHEMADLATHGKTPKIATNKPLSSRGMFSGAESERQKTLLSAAKSGFDYVDTDLSTSNLKEFISEIKKTGAKTVLSFHDFSGTPRPSELRGILEQEINNGADVCKIVTTAKRMEDNLTILNFTASVSSKTKIIGFAMGELGKTSRLLSPLFGGFFTFASLKQGSETAAGQMSIQEMKTAYRLLGLT
jgi:3-dehydroquinate dehydratase type I